LIRPSLRWMRTRCRRRGSGCRCRTPADSPLAAPNRTTAFQAHTTRMSTMAGPSGRTWREGHLEYPLVDLPGTPGNPQRGAPTDDGGGSLHAGRGRTASHELALVGPDNLPVESTGAGRPRLPASRPQLGHVSYSRVGARRCPVRYSARPRSPSQRSCVGRRERRGVPYRVPRSRRGIKRHALAAPRFSCRWPRCRPSAW
jgi:hypothetical protein